MLKYVRRALWALVRLTDPPRVRKAPPGPARPRTIPLPPGIPRHTTVKLQTEPRKRPASAGRLPGSTPPQVRQS